MNLVTCFARRLGLAHPIVQAPMAGGATTPALVAAVSNAGALGSFAAALLPPEEIRAGIREIRALTDRPFNVNLFVATPPEIDPAAVDRANALLQPFRDELGLPVPPLPNRLMQSFSEQAAVLLDEQVPVFSFTFGMPAPDLIAAIRAVGSMVIGTATTVAEGRALAEAGVDAVCGQGVEAGGHRGSFLDPPERSLIGTLVLIPQLVDALDRPVIAAGGIMDGRGLAAVLALGAAAAQLGTAFLTCPESGIAPGFKELVPRTAAEGTALTRTFSGRLARGIENRFMRALAQHQGELPPYPVQLALMRDIVAAARAAGRLDLLALWSGQGAAMARALPAAHLIETLMTETRQVLARLVGPE